jgi:hypothetical protein
MPPQTQNQNSIHITQPPVDKSERRSNAFFYTLLVLLFLSICVFLFFQADQKYGFLEVEEASVL